MNADAKAMRDRIHARLFGDDVDLIDEDPPLGDFHDAAQLAIAKLGSRLGFELPEATPIPLILAATLERIKRYERVLDRWAIAQGRLSAVKAALAADDFEGAKALLREVPSARGAP